MAASIDKPVGVPIGCKKHNGSGFLLVEGRNNEHGLHARVGLLTVEDLLHHLAHTELLQSLLIGHARILDCNLDEITQHFQRLLSDQLVRKN
jgi:hypothetical protein